MDSSSDAFRYEKISLCIFPTSKATMAELETYCDPINWTEVEASPKESYATPNSIRSTRSAEHLRSRPSTKKRREGDNYHGTIARNNQSNQEPIRINDESPPPATPIRKTNDEPIAEPTNKTAYEMNE